MTAELTMDARFTNAADVTRGPTLRQLWSGYGELYRVTLTGSPSATAIVKSVAPPASASVTSISHARKLRSYDVELAWYEHFADRCTSGCRVPRLLGAERGHNTWLLVLEDLDAAGFNRRYRRCNRPDLLNCLTWLARFHAQFLGVAPDGLWPLGSYWHLATRQEEWQAIADPALKAAALQIDAQLSSCSYQTLIHGDAKEDNFCFGKDGVAAVDFQYVGAGCGMKDVAYLLASGSAEHAGVPETECLDHYFKQLRDALRDSSNEAAQHNASSAATVDVNALEQQWRQLYPIACVDFYRFMAGWAPHRYDHDDTAQLRVKQLLRQL